MISELIKLSKELYELEMIDESICIDDMIHKLYGLPFSDKNISYDDLEEGSFNYEYNDIEDELKVRSSNSSFKSELSRAICETFCDEDLKEIIRQLEDYTQ